jgi:OFA family oxalate/formate antiporter-like MFS transporter
MPVAVAERPDTFILRLQRRGLYYGWIVAIAGTVGVVLSVPGQTMGVSVYTNHLLQSLPVDRVQLSMAYMFGTLVSAALLPVVGRLLDRFGARRMGTVAPLGLALALVYLAAAPRLLHGLVAYTGWPARWLAFLLLFAGFLGVRHFGQGQLTVISRTMIGRWFERRRGLVFGISGLFVAFGFGVTPMVLNRLIMHGGWKHSLHVLAGVMVAMALFASLTFRNAPEECGLRIDGMDAATAKVEQRLHPEPACTARQAARTPAFWIFNCGFMWQAMMVSAITFHMGRLAELDNMTAAHAFSVFLPVAAVSTACDLLGGALSDRIPLKYLLAFMQFGLCLGLVGLAHYGSSLGYALSAIGMGIGNGLYSLLTGAAWPKLFGRRHLGAIAGLSMGWIVAASAMGPFLYSVALARTGSFQQALALNLLFPGAVFVASFFANPPARPPLDVPGLSTAPLNGPPPPHR